MALLNIKQPFFGSKKKPTEQNPFSFQSKPFFPTPTGAPISPIQPPKTNAVIAPQPKMTPQEEAQSGVPFNQLSPEAQVLRSGKPSQQQPLQPPAPIVPPEPPKPSGTDFQKFYEDQLGIQKTEAEEAKTREETAFQQTQKAGQALIDQSQKLFDELFKGTEITGAREDRTKAREQLALIDAEETQSINQLKQQQRERGTVSWAALGQQKIVSEGFNARRATFAANEKIAQGRLDEALGFAETAYNHGINILNAKIGLAETALTRATGLKKDEKEEYMQAIKDAKEQAEKREKDKKDNLDLYISLSQAGVKSISLTDSKEEMLKKSGPILSDLALKALENKREKELVDIQKTKEEIGKLRGERSGTTENNKLLSVSDAKALGVPYGTTVGQAKLLGKTPGEGDVSVGIESQKQTITKVDDLLENRGKAGSVGAYGIARRTPFFVDAAAKRDFVAGVQNLTSSLTLDKLIAAKASGATFGALSDEELKLLADSATKISNWEKKDDKGNVYYDISEDLFNKELNRIKDYIEADIVRSGGTLVDDEDEAEIRNIYGEEFNPAKFY